MVGKSKGLFLTLFLSVVILLPAVADCSTGPSGPAPVVNGQYEVSVLKDGQWVAAGSLSFNRFVRTKELELSSLMTEDSAHLVRIVQEGGGAAHIDAVTLGGAAPVVVLTA